MSWPSNSGADAARQRDWRRKYAEADAALGIETTEDFAPFRQRNDIFTRAFWDGRIRTHETDAFFASYRMQATYRKGDGFRQRDFALRNASWLVSDIISNRSAADGRREGFQAAIAADTPVAETRVDIDDPARMAAEIKRIGAFFGADLVGITDFDDRWLYESRVDTRDYSEVENHLPGTITSVIVMAHEMDRELVATYPSALAGAATGREYSHEAAIVMQLAAYIRNLGYEAVPSMNDTALVIPYAIKAGLGEYARNQLVITPEFGPRVRFSKIFTDLPLAHDRGGKIGVGAFCDICTRCAEACPPKALPFGERAVSDSADISAIGGVRKWTSDAAACFGYWAKLRSDCAICMRVCPFNRDFGRVRNRLWLRLALSPLRRLALWLDRRGKRARRLRPRDWWSQSDA